MSTGDAVPIVFRRRFERAGTPADPAYLATLPLFSAVPEKARAKVIEKVARYMSLQEFEPGELILEEGAYNDSAYYVLEGAVDVLLDPHRAGHKPDVRPASGAPVVTTSAGHVSVTRGSGTSSTLILRASPAGSVGRTLLEAGEIFGEISALSRYAVSASVVAAAPVKLLRIQLRGLKTLSATSKDFKKWLDGRYRERALNTHLKQVPLFAQASDAFLAALNQRVELLSFEAGQVIAQEGTPADAFFLVRGGYVKVGVASGGPSLAITYLRKGDYAGETALLLDEPWPFTLQALESVELVKLSREDFHELVAQAPAAQDELWKTMMARLKERGAVLREPVASEHMQMAMDSGLVHGESVLLIDLATCTRCDDCVRGCADAHGGEPRFIREGQRFRNWLIPTSCYQCTDPVCMIDCPTGAITREFGSLEVTINPPTHPTRYCIGCGGCAKRCPWGNITMVPMHPPLELEGRKVDARASKCDKCLGRPEGPACVQSCPHGSAVRISFRELDVVAGTLTRPVRAARQVAVPKQPRNLKRTLAAFGAIAIAAAVGAWLGPWSPKHGVGLAFGVGAALVYLFAAAYPARRGRARPLRSARAWLQAHVYMATVAFAAVILHAGGLPHGFFGWALLVLSAWVAATGFLGVLLQKMIPARISEQLRTEALHERIPELVDGLRAEADAIVEGAGTQLEVFYKDEVRPRLQAVEPSWSYVLDPRSGREAVLEKHRSLGAFLDPDDKQRLEDVNTILIEKLELDAHFRLQTVLRHWVAWSGHAVAAGILVALMLVHVLSWVLY